MNERKEKIQQLRALANDNYEQFWATQAQSLVWHRPWNQILSWEPPFAKWFVGGQLNVTLTCLDQHLTNGRKDKPAIIWESEQGEVRKLSYGQLHQKVCELSAAFAALGVRLGDRVAIYMPLCPEAAIAMLACARIGATHTVIFGGFSAQSVRDRVNDAGCNLVITADGLHRKGNIIPLKSIVDEALSGDACPTVNHVVVLRHAGNEANMTGPRDLWWHECISENARADAVPVDSEHPLFILYTSGTTGKPKGIVHSTGGYLTQIKATSEWVFDFAPDDVYWCTADVGWITGHSYLVYGPLACGATVFMYEGAPTYPQPDRFWQVLDRHQISILYTSPTAIRTFMRFGEQLPQKYSLNSLRLLGSVGEPINPEAWLWYHENIGRRRCPIIDTWWQTETGGMMITPVPGAIETKPGSATIPLPGIDAEIVNMHGEPTKANEGGFLVVRKPWPSMALGIHNDNERFSKTYWSQMPGVYFTGDGAKRDEDGYFWIMGRIDDVVNVSGHRLGTAEVESALITHKAVAETAVVGRPDAVTGQAVVAFVTLKESFTVTNALIDELKLCVAKEIGAFAKPAEIRFTPTLPKTRSGKIMRRLLREIASGKEISGDLTTLEDLASLTSLQQETPE